MIFLMQGIVHVQKSSVQANPPRREKERERERERERGLKANAKWHTMLGHFLHDHWGAMYNLCQWTFILYCTFSDKN